MAEGNKKRFSSGEVNKAIFNDEDSNDEDFDCGSDTEIYPNSEKLINSDMDITEQLQ